MRRVRTLCQRPCRAAVISASTERAISSGLTAPMSRPIGAWMRAISSSREAHLSQRCAAVFGGLAAAHRADVADGRAKDVLEDRQVELRVVAEHGDVGAGVERHLRKGLLGSRADDLGVRETLGRREEAAGVEDGDAEAEARRHRREVDADVRATADDEMRCGHERLNEHSRVAVFANACGRGC